MKSIFCPVNLCLLGGSYNGKKSNLLKRNTTVRFPVEFVGEYNVY